MGVSGTGKSTLARALADRLGWVFREGDDLHGAANVRKMAAGQPLTDADRLPWLQAVRGWIVATHEAEKPGIITCSALKRCYRNLLRKGGADLAFIALEGEGRLLQTRLAGRRGHFMPGTLLASQLADYQPLAADEKGLVVPIALPTEQQVGLVVAGLDEGIDVPLA